MRTETITRELYKFEELSEAAKERARDWYREVHEYGWAEENRESLDAFCKDFPVKATHWRYDAWNYEIVERITCDDEISELTGARLAAYIWNNYRSTITTRKEYKKGGCYHPGVKVRKSRIVLVENSCPFTGYCADESLLEPIRAFLKAPNNRQTFGDLLADCLTAWARDARDDCAYQISDECVDESILANEYEFTADGGRA